MNNRCDDHYNLVDMQKSMYIFRIFIFCCWLGSVAWLTRDAVNKCMRVQAALQHKN
jgi:hypothetical protein